MSATGWSAGGTLLAALVGSLAGSGAGVAVTASGGGAVGVVAVSLLPEFVAVIVCSPATVEPHELPPQSTPSSLMVEEPVRSPRSTLVES